MEHITGDDIKLANKLGVSTNELKKQVLAELQRMLLVKEYINGMKFFW